MNYQTIIQVLRQWFIPPVFPDKEQTRAARWLNFIVLILITLIMGNSIMVISGGLDQAALIPILVSNTVALLVNLIVLLLMRNGYVKSAAIVLLGLLSVLVTYTNAFIFQSVRTPNITAYFVLIPLAGLLMGRRSMNILASLCTVLIIAIFYGEWRGILVPIESSRSIFDDLFVLFFTLIMNTVLFNASVQRVEEKAEEITQTASALSTANQELYTSQLELQNARAELEIKVQQRTYELQQSNIKLQAEVEQRQQLLEALARSEANWRSLAEQSPEVIARINRNYTIAFVNRDIGGRSPEALIGAHAAALHSQAQHQTILERCIATAFQTGETTHYESEEVLNESRIWRVNRVGAIQQSGRVIAVILISTDITEQKQTEAAMYQMQKLESLGVLAGGVAHDFNNLLTAMLMQMSLAATKLATDHPVQRHLQRTVNAAERATELTRQMLNYAGRAQPEIKLLDLNELIMDNIHLFSASIPKSISLQPQLTSNIPSMVGDKGQIQQLIMNLILNSADAIEKNVGTITVVTQIQDLTEEESGQWRWFGTPVVAGRYVRLEVHDTGCGMDAKTLTKIFDPFFTTKFTGRGLGLASVIGIVRAHKGGLHVASTVGKGTTFTMLFPCAEEGAGLSTSELSATTLTGNDELVLIIDDEEIVREGMVDTLTAANLRVLTAADGPTGLQLFRAHTNDLKLILLDLSMPGMDGEEVFYQLQAQQCNIPILLVSGYNKSELMDRFVSKGLAGFIQKPYTAESLLHQVQSYLHAALPEQEQHVTVIA